MITLVAAAILVGTAPATQDGELGLQVEALDLAFSKSRCFPNRDAEGNLYPVCPPRSYLELKLLDVDTDAVERKLKLARQAGEITPEQYDAGLKDVARLRQEYREAERKLP